MDDRPGATVGYAFAGVALVSSFLSWPQFRLPAVLATVALLAFVLRRREWINPIPGATIAAFASAGVAWVAIYDLYSVGLRIGFVVTFIAALSAIVAAFIDWRDVGHGVLPDEVETVFRALDVGAAGIVAIYVWGFIAYGFVLLAVPGQLGSAGTTVLSTVASGLGTLSVVVLYLHFSHRDWSFLDIRVPGLRGLAYVVGGTLAVLGGNLAIGLLFQRLGVESATHTVVQTAEADPSILLVLIPLSYLAIAPGEELLYRNVIQKTLRERFSPVAGVVVASAVFAAVHLPAYSTPGSSFRATLSTLVVIFVLALVLGGIYERTENIVVPILAHGTFNAIAFAVTYWQFTGQFAG